MRFFFIAPRVRRVRNYFFVFLCLIAAGGQTFSNVVSTTAPLSQNSSQALLLTCNIRAPRRGGFSIMVTISDDQSCGPGYTTRRFPKQD